MKETGSRKREAGNPKGTGRKVLVCFALKEEARAFRKLLGEQSDIHLILVGVGKQNAARAVGGALAEQRPDLVLTCGLAGGLRPDLAMGTVVFAADPETGLEAALLAAGAQPARFHCADQVATTAAEKEALRSSTGADAVEMESQSICAVCRAQRIPSATVRVILDTAQEDLALDFNRLLTSEQRLSYWKLALALLKSPAKIGALLRMQRQTQIASERLADVLARVIAAE